jgi:hypothetical protein
MVCQAIQKDGKLSECGILVELNDLGEIGLRMIGLNDYHLLMNHISITSIYLKKVKLNT